MPREELRVRPAAGVELAGTLVLPHAAGPVPVAVGVHGAGAGTRDFHLFRHLEALLPEHGIATLVFDRRGEGASTGSEAAYEELARDVLTWVAALRRDERIGAVGLWGISQGGWIAPLAAAEDAGIAFLVVCSPGGVTPGSQMAYAVKALLRAAGHSEEAVGRALALRARIDEVAAGRAAADETQLLLDEARREPWFPLAFVPERVDAVDETWLRELGFDVRPALRRLRLPILLFFGQGDRWVPIAESVDVWRRAVGSDADLTVVSLAGTGHAPTFASDSSDWLEHGPPSPEYERILVSWLHDRLGLQ